MLPYKYDEDDQGSEFHAQKKKKKCTFNMKKEIQNMQLKQALIAKYALKIKN